MTTTRHSSGKAVRNGIGVHLYLEDDDGRVLLGQRHPSCTFAGGEWHFLAGTLEDEPALACLVRESDEEAGLVIEPGDAELVHTVHLRDSPDSVPLMELVFRVRRWQGTPQIREAHRCLRWRWWHPYALPEPIVAYTRQAITEIRAGRSYSELGWDRCASESTPLPAPAHRSKAARSATKARP